MNRTKLRTTLATVFTLVLLAAPVGCEKCRDEPNVPDPSVGAVGDEVTQLGGRTEEQSSGEERTVGDDRARLQQPESLRQAFVAPDEAVTSEGRFGELMTQGMAAHIPQQGLVFASGGVDEPTVRVALSADGQLRWARGDGGYWEALDEQGEAELSEQDRREAAALVERAWTERELTYPPSAVDRGELLVIRDADTARVIEGTAMPRELAALRELLMEQTRQPL